MEIHANAVLLDVLLCQFQGTPANVGGGDLGPVLGAVDGHQPGAGADLEHAVALEEADGPDQQLRVGRWLVNIAIRPDVDLHRTPPPIR